MLGTSTGGHSEGKAIGLAKGITDGELKELEKKISWRAARAS